MNNALAWWRCAAVILIWVSAISASHAAADPAQYELQERCGRRATEIFEKLNGVTGVTDTEYGQVTATFWNHYSIAQNKCFMVISSTILRTKTEKKGASYSMVLTDVNDNKELGELLQDTDQGVAYICHIASVHCQSKDEWEALTKPYME